MKYMLAVVMILVSNYSCAMEKPGAMVVGGDILSAYQNIVFQGALETIKNNSYELPNYDAYFISQDNELSLDNPIYVCNLLKGLRKQIDRAICAASNRYELSRLFDLLKKSPYKNTLRECYDIDIKQTALRQKPHYVCMINTFNGIKKYEREHDFNQIYPESVVKNRCLKNRLRLLSLMMPNIVFGKKVPLLSYVVGQDHSFFKKIRTSLLLNPSCNINAVDNEGNTALLMACKNGFFEDICALLQHPECDPFCVDKTGLNVLDILKCAQETAEVKALIDLVQAKMNIYKKSIDGFQGVLQRTDPRPDCLCRLQEEIFNVTDYALQDLSTAQKWDKVVDWLCHGSKMNYAGMLDVVYDTCFSTVFPIADTVQKKLFVQKQLEKIQEHHNKKSKEDMLNLDLSQQNNVHNLMVLSLICPNLTVDSNDTPLLSYFIKRAKNSGVFWQALPQLIYNDSCDVNKKDLDGYTPLFHAIEQNDVYVVTYLVKSRKCNREGLILWNYLNQDKKKDRATIMRILDPEYKELKKDEVVDLF